MIKCNILSFSNYEFGNVKNLLDLSSLNYFLQCNLTFIHENFRTPFYVDWFLIFSNLKLDLRKSNSLMFFQFWQLWLFNFNQPFSCTQCKQLQTFTRSLFIILKMMHNAKKYVDEDMQSANEVKCCPCLQRCTKKMQVKMTPFHFKSKCNLQ